MRLRGLLVSSALLFSSALPLGVSAVAVDGQPMNPVGPQAGRGASPEPTPSQPTPSGQYGAGHRAGAADDTGPRPYDPFTFLSLDECRKPSNTAGNQFQDITLAGYAFNHFQWCAWAPVTLLVSDVNDGKPIGSIDYRVTFLAQAPENDREFTTLIVIDKVKPRWPNKVNADNTTVQWVPSCDLDARGGTCSFTSSPSTPQTLSYLKDHPIGITMRSDQTATAANPYAIMGGTLRFTQQWHSTAEFTPDPLIQRAQQGVRCDSASVVSTKANAPACIFNWVGSTLHLNGNDANINEAASHIRDAQQQPQNMEPKPPAGVVKTIPGRLTRHWDDGLNSRQRTASRKACDAAYPPQTGTDCDEFPMASTLEGSLGTPGPGQGTTNYNFSVRRITSGDNRRAGSWTGLWYAKDHLLPGDTFDVDIFDGPVITQEDPPPPAEGAR